MKTVSQNTEKSAEIKAAIIKRLSADPSLHFKVFAGYAIFSDGIIINQAGVIVKELPADVRETLVESYHLSPQLKPCDLVDHLFLSDEKNSNGGVSQTGNITYGIGTPSKLVGELKNKLDNDQSLEYVFFYGHTVLSDGTFYGKTGKRIVPNKSSQPQYKGVGNIRLFINSKYYAIPAAKLIAICFVPNPEMLGHIAYRDGNRQHIHANNIYWASCIQRSNDLLPLNEDSMLLRIKGIDKSSCKTPEHLAIYKFLAGDRAAILVYFYTQKEILLNRIYNTMYPHGSRDDAYEMFHEIIEIVEKVVKSGRMLPDHHHKNPLMNVFDNEMRWRCVRYYKKTKTCLSLSDAI